MLCLRGLRSGKLLLSCMLRGWLLLGRSKDESVTMDLPAAGLVLGRLGFGCE